MVSIHLINGVFYTFIMNFNINSFIDSVVGWYGPNRVIRTTFSRVWSPRAMDRVAGRETTYGVISVAV